MLVICVFQLGRIYDRIMGSEPGEEEGNQDHDANGIAQGRVDGCLFELDVVSNAVSLNIVQSILHLKRKD